MRDLIVIAAVVLGASCVSTGEKPKPTYEKSEVIERIGDLDETPSWSLGITPFTSESGSYMYVSSLTLDGDARPEACSKAAANEGRASILREIRDNLSVSGQLSTSSASSDPSKEEFLVFISQRSLTGVRVVETYWEKRIESDASGERVLRLRCASKVSISKSFLNRQIEEAVDAVAGSKQLIRKKLVEGHQAFIERTSNLTD